LHNVRHRRIRQLDGTNPCDCVSAQTPRLRAACLEPGDAVHMMDLDEPGTGRRHATTLRSCHVLKLPHATHELDEMVSPCFAMICMASSGCRYVTMSRNRHVLYCTLTANRKQKNWSAHVPALGGLHVRHRTKRVPADASTYMFHVTNRPYQGAGEVRCRQRRDQKPTIGG